MKIRPGFLFYFDYFINLLFSMVTLIFAGYIVLKFPTITQQAVFFIIIFCVLITLHLFYLAKLIQKKALLLLMIKVSNTILGDDKIVKYHEEIIDKMVNMISSHYRRNANSDIYNELLELKRLTRHISEKV